MRDLGFEPAETGEYYFLSYNSEDADRIAPLFKALSDSGIPIWYDKGIRYDTLQWSKEIAEHIQNCKAVLFAQTKGLIQKKESYAKHEYTVAKNLGKEIFVLAFDQIDIKSAPTENMFFVDELNNKQQILITENCSRDAEEVCRCLNLEYQNHKDHTKEHKIPLPAIAAFCIALAIFAIVFIIKPRLPSMLTEAPSSASESWTCKWCESTNGYENNLCWKCKMERNTEPTPEPTPLSIKVGDHITFGHYPQTTEGTDSTPIEWRVLDVQGDKALVISEYGLDAQPYNEEFADVTWETCTLRRWLNNEFLNKAFTDTEQAAILTTAVDNSINQGYSSAGAGNDTQDKIFLLSFAEAVRYFNMFLPKDESGELIMGGGNENTQAMAEPTAYAISRGANADEYSKTENGHNAGLWMLRSAGIDNWYVFFVGYGAFIETGNDATESDRPALWLDLNAI